MVALRLASQTPARGPEQECLVGLRAPRPRPLQGRSQLRCRSASPPCCLCSCASWSRCQPV
eukprot:3428204-Prymnesium_polylepis.1